MPHARHCVVSLASSQGGAKLEDFGNNFTKALNSFKKQYLDKTGNSFGHKKDEFVTSGLPSKLYLYSYLYLYL